MCSNCSNKKGYPQPHTTITSSDPSGKETVGSDGRIYVLRRTGHSFFGVQETKWVLKDNGADKKK